MVRAAAFSVHLLTASGALWGLLALMAAVRGDWTSMFWWLALALVIDGVDGPLARHLKVEERLPNWSGDSLDFVVDFVTYVFVPAYAIAAGGLLPDAVAPLLGGAVAITGALYFADTRMKLADNCFRVFPALRNAVAFYLFLLKPPPWIGAAGIALLLVLTFIPFPFVHPIRVVRWRLLTLALGAVGSVLAAVALTYNLSPPPWIAVMLSIIGLYFFSPPYCPVRPRMFRMLDLLADPHAWAALLTLTTLEIVLGIDNLVFISILVARCDQRSADRARRIGLSLALVFRLALLFTLTALIALRAPIFTIFGMGISWRDIILIGGGLFLMAKAVHEIHGEIEPHERKISRPRAPQSFFWTVVQLIVVDLVFSIDWIITAIGMAQDIEIMVAAVIIAMIVMYAASGPVSNFVTRHPTTKMLALAFLMLIGVALVADGFEFHIPRGYIYFAMAFAGAVELFNVLASRQRRLANEKSAREG